MSVFKVGVKVVIDECYLTDEVTEGTETSATAIVLSEPTDIEELVQIQYESGVIDAVPQSILTIDLDVNEEFEYTIN